MRIKVCGLTRQEDVTCARDLGADFGGFIFHPASPRFIAPADAARLQTGALGRVGVFVTQTLEDIKGIAQAARLDFIQLHGDQPPAWAAALGARRIIRVIWPARYACRADLETALAHHADTCAFYLFDAGVRGGGNGRPDHWDQLRDLAAPRPWFLAGGLTPANTAVALVLRPDGLDFNSGLEEAPGKKNHALMRAAFSAARPARKEVP